MEGIILQIFSATRAVLKIGEYSRIFPSFSWGILGHVTRLDHSRERKYLMNYNCTYLRVCPREKPTTEHSAIFYDIMRYKLYHHT